MKKIHALIPSLVLLSATPLLSLAGCSSDTPTEQITFNISRTETTDEMKASIYLDWEPSGDSIEFTSLEALCPTIEISDAQYVSQVGDRPQQIDLTFSKPIEQDLDDVSIEFDYIDNTLKKEGSAKLSEIHIDKYAPDKPMEIEWDYVKDGEYAPTAIKTDAQPITQEEAFATYLTDIKDNPKILIEDILNTENVEYWELLHVYQATIETYTVKYEIIDFNADKSLVSLKINRNISYTSFISGSVKIETDLTLTNIEYTSAYSMSHKDGKVFNCWSFAPGYFGYGIDDFKTYMLGLETGWEINGSISLPLTEPATQLDFDHWNIDNVASLEISDLHLQLLNQEYYGVDDSYYYSQCPVATNKEFEWNSGEYQINITKDEKKQYFGCDFTADEFESGDCIVKVLNHNSEAVKNLDINCNINGNFRALHTNMNGEAEIGEIEKGNNLILCILNWPSTANSLNISIERNNKKRG